MKTQPYAPPPGYYDLPFTWAFDASIFANGSNQKGNSIYLLGGYGDFLLRRVVGLDRILAADGTGMYRLSRASRNVYMSSDPVQAPNSPELAIVPGELYPETGTLYFDLYGIDLPANPLTGQLAFQGIRRQKGNPPRNPTYKAYEKTFTYQTTGVLTQVASANAPVVTFRSIVDYDFELYQVILMQASGIAARPAIFAAEEGAALSVASVGGVSGTINLLDSTGTANVPLSIAVVGTAITVHLATNNTGFTLNSGNTQLLQVINLINSTPASAAIAFATYLLPGGPFGIPINNAPGNNQLPFFAGVGGSALSTITTPVCSLSIFDSNRVKISNKPIMDIFYNGGPGSPYENGALVTPLWYPKDSVLEIDFFSQITNASLLPTSVIAYLVGKQYIPC
jgi:hypothetical protein